MAPSFLVVQMIKLTQLFTHLHIPIISTTADFGYVIWLRLNLRILRSNNIYGSNAGLYVVHKIFAQILSVTALLLLLLLLLFKTTKVKEIILFVCGQPVSYKKDIRAGLIQPAFQNVYIHPGTRLLLSCCYRHFYFSV